MSRAWAWVGATAHGRARRLNPHPARTGRDQHPGHGRPARRTAAGHQHARDDPGGRGTGEREASGHLRAQQWQGNAPTARTHAQSMHCRRLGQSRLQLKRRLEGPHIGHRARKGQNTRSQWSGLAPRNAKGRALAVTCSFVETGSAKEGRVRLISTVCNLGRAAQNLFTAPDKRATPRAGRKKAHPSGPADEPPRRPREPSARPAVSHPRGHG